MSAIIDKGKESMAQKKSQRNHKKNSASIWRSAEEIISPESIAADTQLWNDGREFPASVQELIDRAQNANLNRKSFLTLMGASLSLAGVSCMKAPVEKIVPYVERPIGHIPGKPVYYATARVTADAVTPVLVKTREGKPIKIEGHEDHPLYRGAVSADTLATIWDLYDPDRLKTAFIKEGNTFKEAKTEEVLAAVAKKLTGTVRILAKASFSPSERKALAELAKATKAKVVTYDAIGALAEIVAGDEASYGSNVVPAYRIDKADFILAIENDFLGTWLSPELFTRQFASRRNPDKGDMNRLVVVESNMTLTGSNADSRLTIHAGSHGTLALALANLLLPGSPLAGDAAVRNTVSGYTPAVAAAVTGLTEEQIVALAEELKANKGKSLVLGGGTSSKDARPGSLQIAVNLLNSILGNEGQTISTKAALKKTNDLSDAKAMGDLLEELNSGKVDVLIIDRANPVYELPGLGMADAIRKAKTIIYLGYHKNDTAVEAHYLLPVSHYLESWGDAESYGYYYVVQPAIRELFDTRSAGDILLALAGSKQKFSDIVRQSAKSYIKGDFETAFTRALSMGYVVVETEGSSPARKFRSAALANVIAPKEALSGYRVSLYRSVAIGDGSGANISFRQELPDPISKMTWDNYVAVSVADAKANTWKMGDVLRLKTAKATLELPLFIQPGLRKGSLAVAIGYGQTNIGQVAAGVGRNAYELAIAHNGVLQYSAIPVTVEQTSNREKLATTQKHYELGVKRGLVRIATLEDYRKNPRAGHEHEEVPHPGPDGKSKAKGLYTPHKYTGNRWNLNVDLTKCTGCSACVISCYSENNIPVVGKDDVLMGREMSWLRIDRYYSYQTEEAEKADPDMVSPDVFFQPVMCQHCENAPCENVCPVGATGHSDDGLNYMSYNRCIGTRYCANNCPYKVRRFNYFEYWDGKLRDPQQFSLNPDVTVRSRGVIEKCSFCQQRISEKRQAAKVEGRELKDGEIKTACQQSCPADAITFGNIHDSGSQISAKTQEPRTYKILAQLNVEPAVSYQVRIKNQGKA